MDLNSIDGRLKMKNILFVIPYLGGGGAERVLIDLMNVLNRQQKYNITLLQLEAAY